ncbi:MAG: ankyrin repeat domain-containing protein [Candidatus Dependentiae bacterium]
MRNIVFCLFLFSNICIQSADNDINQILDSFVQAETNEEINRQLSLLQEKLLKIKDVSCDVNVLNKKTGICLLHYALGRGYKRLFVEACDKKCADFNVYEQGSTGKKPFLYWLVRQPDGFVKLALKSGADPELKDADGQNALHIASFCGKTEICRMFLTNYKMPVNETSNYGATPLHCASYLAHTETIALLLKHGARKNVQDYMLEAFPIDFLHIGFDALSDNSPISKRFAQAIALLK